MAKTSEGRIIKVGDWVGFKADHEEYGQVKSISGHSVTVAVSDEHGGTENRYTYADRIWHED